MFSDEILLVVAVCVTLCAIVYYRGLLTLDGALAAMAFGLVIGLAGGISWIFLLLVFLLTSFAATRYKFKVKQARNLQEGKSGERGWRNVVANGLPAFIIAILVSEPLRLLDMEMGSILFLCAIAVAAADTIASELGVFANRTWLITTMKPVKAGVDGGISVPGQLAAASAAFYTGLIGLIIFHLMDGLAFDWTIVALVLSIGFLGCQVDSVIGATLETRDKVSKLTNNLLSISIGTFLAWTVLTWLL